MPKFLAHGKERWVDGYLYTVCQKIREMMDNDRDVVCIVDGGVGEGKSTLAQTLAFLVDGSFSADRLYFDHEEFKTGIINSPKKRSHILDETMSALNVRRAMSTVNVTLTALFSEIRQKNLFIILCLPSIFDLDKNIAIHRSLFLVHAYSSNGKRGFFRFYGRKSKAKLFADSSARRTYSYSGRATFYGRFQGGYLVDEEKYRQRKDDVLKRYMPVNTELEVKAMNVISDKSERSKRVNQILMLVNEKQYSFSQLEELGFGSRSALSKLVKEYNKKDEGNDDVGV